MRTGCLPLVLVAFVFAAVGDTEAVAAPRARPWPLMPTEEFWRQPQLRSPVDAERLDYALLAAALFHETNRVRREHQLRPFSWLAKLDRAADLQANSGALDQSAGHINVLPSLLTVADRLERVGLVAGRAAENAALMPIVDVELEHEVRITSDGDRPVLADAVTGRIGQPHTYESFARSVVKAWMNSPGHRDNILNPELLSLGCSGRVTKRIASPDMIACVQVFFSPPIRAPRHGAILERAANPRSVASSSGSG